MTSSPPNLSTLVHHHIYGVGPVRTVGLHGWAGDHKTYEALAPHLPPHSALMAVDMPGYGQSFDPQTWTLRAIRDRLLEHLEGRIETPCTLVGNCSGAVIAILLAQARPDWFDRVILIEPFAFTPWYFRLFLMPGLGRFFYWNAFENPLGRWLVDLVMRDQKAEGRDLMEGFYQTRAKTALSYLSLMSSLEKPHQFTGLQMSVVLVFGRHTMRAVKKSIKIWCRVWPQAGVYRVEDAGHLLLQESPHLVGRILGHSDGP